MNDYCQSCAIRLFNNEHYNLQGFGNPNYGNLIILPSVDYNASKNNSLKDGTQAKIVTDILSSTGDVQRYYITTLIRCNQPKCYKMNHDMVKNCMKYLIHDFNKYNFKHILVLGEASNHLLQLNSIGSNLKNIYVSKNYRLYNINYSPLIKETNKELYNIFKENLLKWYNYVTNGYYNNYNLLAI